MKRVLALLLILSALTLLTACTPAADVTQNQPTATPQATEAVTAAEEIL